MRFVVARMNHETNTFSPVPTPLASFNPRWDEDALQAGTGSRTAWAPSWPLRKYAARRW